MLHRKEAFNGRVRLPLDRFYRSFSITAKIVMVRCSLLILIAGASMVSHSKNDENGNRKRVDEKLLCKHFGPHRTDIAHVCFKTSCREISQIFQSVSAFLPI